MGDFCGQSGGFNGILRPYGVSTRAGGAGRCDPAGAGRIGRYADGGWQISVLSGPRAAAAGAYPGGVAADLPDEGPGRRTNGGRRPGGVYQ